MCGFERDRPGQMFYRCLALATNGSNTYNAVVWESTTNILRRI
jgi:hypothetical protein